MLMLAATAAAATAASSPAAPRTWSGPYQDVSLGLQAGRAAFDVPAWVGAPAPGRVLFWAFATGECGEERWGAVDTAAFAAANVAAFVAAGRDYVVSTGGEAGIFTCGSDEGMLRFVQRYLSPRLVGLDFDIEGAQTPAQIDDLVRRAALAQVRWPHLRISFTLATHAASDGSLRSLNATGEAVLRAIGSAGLSSAVINLMVMNYGAAEPRWCVPAASPRTGCDMGRSALQAVDNVHRKYGLPHARLAITAMPGENDVPDNVTRPEDAARMAGAARALGLAGVHHWSIHRDRPCDAGSPRVSPRCHALTGLPVGHFDAVLRP